VKSGTLGSITYFLFLPIAQNLPIPIPILRKLPILFQNFQFSSNENWKLIGKKLEGDWRKLVYCVGNLLPSGWVGMKVFDLEYSDIRMLFRILETLCLTVGLE